MTLTDQELATLRAALHCWQNELGFYATDELREYYPDLRDAEPVTIDEVEGLLVRLERAAGLPPGSGAPTVSTVRASAAPDGAGPTEGGDR